MSLFSSKGPGYFRLGATRVYVSNDTWNRPAGLRAINVMVLAAGGGGAGADGASVQASCSSGGGAGGRSIKFILVSALGSSETVTIGAAGAAGTAGANPGGTGGTSSFGAHCSATGGIGGSALGAATTVGHRAGGDGGVGSGGDVNTVGASGQTAFRVSGVATLAGTGASSPYGMGGVVGGQQNDGGPGVGFGSGGAGGASITTTDQAGGVGSQGLIIVEEYY